MKILFIRQFLVDGVEIAVLEIFVDPAVDGISAANDDLVELATGRVPELGAELVLNYGEVGDGIVGDRHQRSGDGLIVVVGTFDGEVILAGAFATDRWPGARAQAAGAAYASLQ